MSRLIDADEIIKETWGVVIKDMFHMDETVDVISRKDIDNAPTVNAIPIEWINNWLNTGRNAKYFIPMMKMVEEWEKENANDKEKEV